MSHQAIGDLDSSITVNGDTVYIGQTINELQSFSAVGLLSKLALAPLKQWGNNQGRWIWSKNPEIIFFGDLLTRVIGNDPQATSRELICGTSAYLHIQNNRVARLHTQIFSSIVIARDLGKTVRSDLFRLFGPCLCSGPIKLSRWPKDTSGTRDTLISAWETKLGHVVFQISQNGDGVFVHVIQGGIPHVIKNVLSHKAKNIHDLMEYRDPFGL